MTTKILKFVNSNIESFKPYFSRLNFSEIAYQLFLLFLGMITLFLIVLIKSKTVSEFWGDPLLFFYTIFVTTFQLSRVVGAMFYKHSVSKITQSLASGGGMSRS